MIVSRLKELIEIIAYVPFQTISIVFLNRSDSLCLTRNGRDPKAFLMDAYSQIDRVFATGPSGSTPALEKLQMSLINGQGKQVARYFFGDGLPNGGVQAQKKIVEILKARQNPAGNPVTFLSCTNEDAAVEWMKDAEEVVAYCSESDDFADERNEVLKDQGMAFPFTYGFYLVCALVGKYRGDACWRRFLPSISYRTLNHSTFCVVILQEPPIPMIWIPWMSPSHLQNLLWEIS